MIVTRSTSGVKRRYCGRDELGRNNEELCKIIVQRTEDHEPVSCDAETNIQHFELNSRDTRKFKDISCRFPRMLIFSTSSLRTIILTRCIRIESHYHNPLDASRRKKKLTGIEDLGILTTRIV